MLDLQIEPRESVLPVSGTQLYVAIEIKPLSGAAWKVIKTKCRQEIGSLVELLQGNLSKSVMGVVAGRDHGLFPAPREIKVSCSCPA
jgi:uncharacterized Zn finger protein